MNTLYINIIGEDIQSTENITVIGKPRNAIINEFYLELVNGIVEGVNHPNIDDERRKSLVTDFEANNKVAFAKITEQWEIVKKVLLGEKPVDTYNVILPQEYVNWLYNHSKDIYNKIATCLAKRNNTAEISIEAIYKEAVGFLNNIDLSKKYDQLVVNDDAVKEKSRISVDIRKKIGEAVPFIMFSDWTREQDPPKCPKCGKNPCECVSGIPYVYDKIEDFHEGLACVERDGQYGFIDTRINEVIPCEYDETSSYFENGFCSVAKEKRDGIYKCGVIDRSGKQLFWGDYDWDVVCGFEYDPEIEGFLCSKNEKCGIIDKQGGTIVPFVWDNLHTFHNGVALAQKNNQWCIIDKNGDVLKRLPSGINEVGWDDDGIIPVKKGNKWGCINLNFNVVVNFKYDRITPIGNGLFEVVKNRLHGLIDEQGVELVRCQYDRLWSMRDNEFIALWRTDDYWQFFNTISLEMIKGCYKGWCGDYTENDEEVYIGVVNDNDQGVLIDGEGNVVLSTEYRRVGVPHEGLIKAEYYDEYIAEDFEDDDDFDENDYMTWGMIDIKGNEIIPFIYDEIGEPHSGLIVVKFKGEYCIINSQNELVFANNVDAEEWKQACENGYV